MGEIKSHRAADDQAGPAADAQDSQVGLGLLQEGGAGKAKEHRGLTGG